MVGGPNWIRTLGVVYEAGRSIVDGIEALVGLGTPRLIVGGL
jgi:hypothetical protein